MAKTSRATVGGENKPPRSGWQTAFTWGIVTMLVAVVVLVVVIASVLGKSGNANGTVAAADSAAPEATAPAVSRTKAPPVTATKPPGGGSPTVGQSGTAGPNGDDTPLVRCGDIMAPVDKNHRLASDCAPPDLVTLPASISTDGTQEMRAEAATALQEMFAAARKAGFQLLANSTYRSFETQVQTYSYWVQVSGKEYADRTSALAGHSEHQMGTAADVGTEGHLLEGFTGTPAATWVAGNSWKYGFIVSYPEGKEPITGYAAEPWHVRYVGKDVAAKVHASGLTLHEYLLR